MSNVTVRMEKDGHQDEEYIDVTDMNSFEISEFTNSVYENKIDNVRKLSKRKNKIQEEFLQVNIH